MAKAIAILDKDKWLRANKSVEAYKKLGGAFEEGSTKELESMRKYTMVELGKEKPAKLGKKTKKTKK